TIPVNLGFAPEPIRRVVVLIIQLGAIFYAGWLSWRRWAPEIEAAGADRKRIYRLVQASVVPLGIALYFNLTGHTERSQLWTAGTLVALELAVGLFVATEIFGALVREGLRHPLARRVSFTVRKRRRRAAHLLIRLARWGAVLVFLYLTLTNFDVLDPTVEAVRLAMRETYEFGEIRVSAGDVVAFLLMIVGTIAVMRIVHALLDLEILPRLELEQGIASAISLSVSYVLVAIGVVLAFGVAGVGPERLALLGGALGVGIGFGLQNVVSNFVSGLILVAERPIKVGDIIEIGELVGTVRRIGIRSSTVESLDGAEVIVPNADLIAGRLVNWTLSDARRRLELTVGTTYAGSPDVAREVLLKVVRSQSGVLHDPPADVICVGFGDSSVDFSIRAWTAGYLDAVQVKSRLAMRVHAALEREGIEIPFPQRDLHLRSVAKEAAERLRDEAE
ncbi:MAG: mechanosensitive ion channel, partial [Sandaracinaceae bacterium]